MAITLYHGSTNIIRTPQFGYGKTTNDYGRGFYCTRSADLGKEWAAKNNSDGFLNRYLLHDEQLQVLNLESPDFCVLHWVTILLKYRSFYLKFVESEQAKEYLIENFSVPEEQSYDIITGYRADDSYFMYAEDFLNGRLSYENLKKSILLGQLGTQVMLKSERAFQNLEFQEATQVSQANWYEKYQNRDKNARQDYRKLSRSRARSAFDIDHIVEEGVKANDPRL